jgi:murein DD-endopeptidase MepM/ murein hydrolase activator NlpD
VDEPASRLGHGDERAKYNQCCVHGLPPASLDETSPVGRIEPWPPAVHSDVVGGLRPQRVGLITGSAPPGPMLSGMTTATVQLLGLLVSAPIVLAGPPAQVFAGLDVESSPAVTSVKTRASAVLPSPVDGPTARPRVTSGTGAWPLAPRPAVARGFDPPVTRYSAGHRGVDLVGYAGQTVRAAAAGRVTFAGRLAGRGVVVVSHGSTRTTYEPVHAVVDVGTSVGAGQPLGNLEIFGSHCAPASCLHWGLIQGDTYLDPLSLVGAGPVRLLPLLARGPGLPP